jgi:hypothetical protein
MVWSKREIKILWLLHFSSCHPLSLFINLDVDCKVWARVMVFNAIFNNISAISWRSVAFVEETGVPRENHRSAASRWQILSHKVISIIRTFLRLGVRVMVFNATFNNISVISPRSVLLVKETRVPGETRRPVASHWHLLSHNIVSSIPYHERD